MLIFGLPMVAPVLGLSGDAALPACCRRAGAHHCAEMGTGGMQRKTGLALRAPKCPAYPAAAVQVRGGYVGFVVGSLRFGGVVSQPTLRAQAMARARMAREKTRGMRGPPVQLKA